MCLTNIFKEKEVDCCIEKSCLGKRKRKGKERKGAINLRVGNVRGTGGRKRRESDTLLFQLKIFLKRHKPNYNPQMVSQQTEYNPEYLPCLCSKSLMVCSLPVCGLYSSYSDLPLFPRIHQACFLL